MKKLLNKYFRKNSDSVAFDYGFSGKINYVGGNIDITDYSKRDLELFFKPMFKRGYRVIITHMQATNTHVSPYTYKFVFQDLKTNKLVTFDSRWFQYDMFRFMSRRFKAIKKRNYRFKHERSIKASRAKYER